MANDDFEKITGSTLSSCSTLEQNTSCGYNNDLIDNKGFYWFATAHNASSSVNTFDWIPSELAVGAATSRYPAGVRPVIKLDSSIIIVDGSGTEDDPYIIENPNSVKDLSGNMNNGALVNDPVWDKMNGKLTTNGVDNYVNVGLANYDFGDSATIIVKFKFNSLPNQTSYDIFNNYQEGGLGIGITHSTSTGNYLKFSLFIGSDWYTTRYFSDEITTNEWYTIVGTYDGSVENLYINGSLMNSAAVTGNIVVSPMPINIGTNLQSSGLHINYTPATYDYALVYDRAITEEEVIANFSGNTIDDSTLDKTDLLVYYDFEE